MNVRKENMCTVYIQYKCLNLRLLFQMIDPLHFLNTKNNDTVNDEAAVGG